MVVGDHIGVDTQTAGFVVFQCKSFFFFSWVGTPKVVAQAVTGGGRRVWGLQIGGHWGVDRGSCGEMNFHAEGGLGTPPPRAPSSTGLVLWDLA